MTPKNIRKNSRQFISFFRQTAPYIHQHRNKTFVFCLQVEGLDDATLQALLHDIAILHSLRVRVVIVYGVRTAVNQRLKHQHFHQQKRITDFASMQTIREVVGSLRIRIEAILSMGLANSPMQGAGIQVSSGNFVIAKPIGVRDGVDFGLTGEVRKIHAKAIAQRLDAGDMVIVPPLGYSSTGEVFNLTAESVAGRIATTIKADKLLFFSQALGNIVTHTHEGKAITPIQAEDITTDDVGLSTVLAESIKACQQGVNRVHLVPKETDGAVLAELYTRDGIGLMITNQAYDRIEQATTDDIPSLLALIRPLERQGILVRRSRELLEMEIGCFSLLKRDNTVIGCAALYPYQEEKMAELGCVAVSPEYREQGLADVLLATVEETAKSQGLTSLFCLTTHTAHWFAERGFRRAELDELPKKKQNRYDAGRNSSPYLKEIG